MKKIVVHVDPDLADLIPGFLANKRRDIGEILTAADAADYATLADLGHRIKGEGGGYGLNVISTIGAALEAAAMAHDRAAAQRCASELGEYLDALEVVFE